MGAVLGIAIVALLALILVVGLSPIMFVPVGIVVLGIVLRPLLAGLYSRPSPHARADTPTTGEASYEPVTNPAER